MRTRMEPVAGPVPAEYGRGAPARAERFRQAGFSAAEVVASVFLFVSLVTAARPVFYDLVQTYALHGAARSVFAQLQRSRMAAVAQNARYRFSVNASRDVTVCEKASPTSPWTQVDATNAGELDAGPGPSAITVIASGDIVFAPNGSAPLAGTVTVMNRLQRYKRIVVESSGQIRIE